MEARPDCRSRALRCRLLVSLLLALGIVLWSMPGWSQGPDRYSLDAQLQFLVDPSDSLSLAEALRSDQWQQNRSGKVINRGFSDDTLWVRARVPGTVEGAESRYLVIPYPLLEQVRLYVRDPASGALLSQSDQSQLRAQQSLLYHFYFMIFPLPEDSTGTLDLVLQVKSATSLQVPLEVWSEQYLVRYQIYETLFWGLYFGVILALGAFNLFVAWSVRDKAYLYYVFYLASMAGVMLTLSGLGSAYLWPQDPTFHRYVLPTCTALTVIWALLFTRKFLYPRGFPGKLDATLAVITGFALVLILYSWTEPLQGLKWSGVLGGLVVVLVTVAGIRAWSAGVVIARYFVLAWLMFAAGAVVYLLAIFGVLPVSRFSNHAFQIGSALEAVFLCFALAHRIKEERQEKLDALQQRHQAEQQVRALERETLEYATRDPVTRMPNEALLLARLQELIHAASPGQSWALVILHFPQMKELLSSLGRGLSESLFRTLTRQLNLILVDSPSATFIEEKHRAYLAVLDFGSLALICETSGEEGVASRLVSRIMRHFESPIDVSSVAVSLDLFAGIACYPSHGDRADLLLQYAGAAKDEGLRRGERIFIYSPELDAYGRRRLALMGALSRAIGDNELELYLQPQMDCSGRGLVGAEILLRWNSPRYGRVSPGEFIEIAESAGLMGPLTRYVVRRSLELLHSLNQNGLHLTLSINLSVQNLIEPDFVRFITTCAEHYQVRLSDLILEVTETTLIEKVGTVVDNLEQLSAAGCSIALDDFGTGYSSLAYLSRLPIHELKIDRSFISQMKQNLSNLRIVENTIKLARTLRIQTVAEGIEDRETLEAVTRMGCDRVQGYHISRPMPAAEFRYWAMQVAG